MRALRDVASLAAAFLLAACTSPAPPPSPPTVQRACFDRRTAELVRLTNTERVQRGLSALEADRRLQTAAQEHADDMARGDFMAHEGSDRSLPAGRVDAAGYRWKELAENVAAGFADVAAVHAGWMQSAGHRENILTPNFRHMGVGYASRPDTQLRWYWVEVFGLGEERMPTPTCS